MGKILLKRTAMSQLLHALKRDEDLSPIAVIQSNISPEMEDDIPDFLYKFEKRKGKKDFGLSTNEIVTLSTICELTSLKSTSIQNWIKRDIKELIGSPEFGKKYSIEQTALLFIVKDLKAVFDFETIRQMLTKVFNTLSDRSDDLISPLQFFQLYAKTLENIGFGSIHISKASSLEHMIEEEVKRVTEHALPIKETDRKVISHILVVTVMSVLSFHLQLRTLTYANTIIK